MKCRVRRWRQRHGGYLLYEAEEEDEENLLDQNVLA